MSDVSARQDLLDSIAAAVAEMAFAVASLGEAYDSLDETTGDRLEERLFRPAQHAYGVAQRTHAEFAGRHKLPTATFAPGHAPAATHGPRPAIDAAVDAARNADNELSELQDSFAPVEYGDEQLRAGLAETRRLLAEVIVSSREFVRTLGR
ncbi:MAG: hypothetical protein JWM73_1046 [Solirubrobacterales bacterium]|jgi:hypothetical protein|nr:hypothetical protein [Solirubrobacterales bacterium]